MRPSFVFANPADGRNRKREFGSDLFQKPSMASEGTDCQCLILGDFGIVMLRAGARRSLENAIRVSLIVRMSRPFQIAQAIVALLSVFVVRLMIWGRLRAYECEQHQNMHRIFFLGRIAEKCHAHIAFLGTLQFPQTANLVRAAICPAPNASYATLIADFVDAFISRYVFPSLGHCTTIPLTEVR